MARRTTSSTERENGQAIVIIALAMIGLLAFAALAVDGGNSFKERRVAQNAADAGALAGARTVWVQRTEGIGFEEPVLIAINTAAEANGIEDTDGAPGNQFNDNVQAFYTDQEGNLLPGTNVIGVQGFVPPEAEGIRVVAKREFRAFIAQIIGRSNLAADAEAIAVFLPYTGCGTFAIYAGCDNCSPNTVNLTGSELTINGGGIHSDDDIKISQRLEINDGGYIEYGSTCGPHDCNSVAPSGQEYPPPPWPPLWDIADFRPGGSEANAAGSDYHVVNGDLKAKGKLADGLYYVTGKIELQDPVGKVTLVAEGGIKISGGADIHTYRDYWPLLFSNCSGGPSCPSGAVDISGDNALWTGFIYAPNGTASISSANNSTLSGAIYANQVDLHGARISIDYSPSYCPLGRARIVLLK
ncbi:MAG TPA: pilus assembly protein TadG-related protein [Anaerolineae bacterium]|nr:pilus assembly protein TadG-related protein [Anaerolineae bacterium]